MSQALKQVVGIGELLWDLFPTGPRLGGAPFNFSFHCNQLGARGVPVSAVGHDDLGLELRDVLVSLEIPSEYVVGLSDYPTGTVDVVLDGNGKPTYEIKKDVAWDFIPQSEKLLQLASTTDAVCFGSLAQRNNVSRNTLRAFIKNMPEESLRIFDVNLRQSFFNEEIVRESLDMCNVLKLSDEELPVVAEMFGLFGSVDDRLKQLIERFELKLVAYTRGAEGSLLMAEDDGDDHPGCPTTAVNSVGAGDSFTATLCAGLLKNKALAEINAHANRVATFVCSQDSATPVLPEELRKGKIHA